MTPRDIEMAVLDSLQNDTEDVVQLLHILNGADDDLSWESARGMPFHKVEVQAALVRLMDKGLVIPHAALEPELDTLRPIPRSAIGVSVPWEEVWFDLTVEGRRAIQEWWKNEGDAKYPPPEE
jgi:hypothetical protein